MTQIKFGTDYDKIVHITHKSCILTYQRSHRVVKMPRCIGKSKEAIQNFIRAFSGFGHAPLLCMQHNIHIF